MSFWWACDVRQRDVHSLRNFDGGKEVIEASSLREAIVRLTHLQIALHEKKALWWLKLTRGIFGPFLTKERAEQFRPYDKNISHRKRMIRIHHLPEQEMCAIQRVLGLL